MELDIQIEGVLFYKAAPVKKQVIAEFFGASDEEVDAALDALADRLKNGATRLTRTLKEVQLVTAPELSESIEKLRKDDLKKDIGKAGAETLAIVLYRGPISRAEIDRVRGVNSSFILRNLMIRGLVERQIHPTDSRSFTYSGTPNLLSHLGISKREELQDFGEIMNALDVFEQTQIAEEKERENKNSVFDTT